MFGCKHKYGQVQKDRYQYCVACGRAKTTPCNHKWEKVHIENIITKTTYSIFYILQCSECGDTKRAEIE